MLKHEIEHHPFASQPKTQAENKHRLLKGLVQHIGHMPKVCSMHAIQKQFESHLLICAEEENLARLEEAELKTLQTVFPEPNTNDQRPYALTQGLGFVIRKAIYHKKFAEGKIKKLDVPEHFRDKNFYRLVVSIKGSDLNWVPPAMRDETIITTAVWQDYNVLNLVPEDQRTEALYLSALKTNHQAMLSVPELFKKSTAFLLKAYDQNCNITQEMYGLTHALLNGALAARATQKAGQSALSLFKHLTKQ